MDGLRGALLPIAASFRLRAKKPDAGAESCHGMLGEVQAEEVG
jgi:hypothetical protein